MLRRLIDVVVSTLALITAAPLLVCIALLVWYRDGSPIFFLQWRAGRGAVPFRIIKFRTMREGAEEFGRLTFQADRRITPIGRFLRRWKLDEFPQLLNVLRGEMTLIGPRPEVLDWVERYTSEQREVLGGKPGLTDPVQILFRHEQDFLTSAAEYERLFAIKVQKQIVYLRSRTALSDFAIALQTLHIVFASKPSNEELAVYSAIRTEKEMDSNAVISAGSGGVHDKT